MPAVIQRIVEVDGMPVVECAVVTWSRDLSEATEFRDGIAAKRIAAELGDGAMSARRGPVQGSSGKIYTTRPLASDEVYENTQRRLGEHG